SASMRTVTGAWQCVSPVLSALTNPRCGVETTTKRRSRAATARTCASVSSVEPSSTTMHSQPDTVWRVMLRRHAGSVSPALYAGRRREAVARTRAASLPRQAEAALADDVLLDLRGAAADDHAEREHELERPEPAADGARVAGREWAV